MIFYYAIEMIFDKAKSTQKLKGKIKKFVYYMTLFITFITHKDDDL